MKANSVRVFKTIKELKDSRINRPFDPDKYERYIEGLKKFHRICLNEERKKKIKNILKKI